MIIPCYGVSGIADIGDSLTLPGEVSFRQTLGISIQVRIVKDEPAISAQLINGRAATIAVKKFHDGSVRGGDHGSSERRWNIDRVVDPAFGTRFRKCIAQLIGPHTGDRNNQRWWRVGNCGRCLIGG